ncbi:hypothetical protein [Culturomica massiliensis]|uniref:hypothetical protein n=1 Tax=Culturomica massiliensis TaxID=1841857 RepID=UPI002352577D|nr:hypothetical protein [Culturomica massiliensis]
MMTKKYVLEQIGLKLSEELKPYGFRFIKSKNHIIKQIKSGFDLIEYRIIDYTPIFLIELALAIRLNTVEDIVNRFLGEEIMNPQGKPSTLTSGISFHFLMDNYSDIKVGNEEELNDVISEYIIGIKARGLQYFDEYNNLFNANKLKKESILNDTTGMSYMLRNLMQSLVLMKLCNDPDLEVLYPKYLEYYVPISGQEITGRKAIVDLFEYLKKM